MLYNRKLHCTVGYFRVSTKYIVNYDCTIVDYLFDWPLMWVNKETYSVRQALALKLVLLPVLLLAVPRAVEHLLARRTP